MSRVLEMRVVAFSFSLSLVGSPRISQTCIPEMAVCSPKKWGETLLAGLGPKGQWDFSIAVWRLWTLSGPEINALHREPPLERNMALIVAELGYRYIRKA